MATIKSRGPGGTRSIDRARLLVRLAIEPMTAKTTDKDAAPLQLRLLGAPHMALPNGTTHALERRTAALLALLALNGATPRSKAAALVWPEADDQRASNSLRQRIFKLRQFAGRDVIVTDKAISLARDIAHDLHEPLSRLAADAESCQGDLLGDCDFAECPELDEWVGVARQRWRGELARALAELASRLEGEGRIALALRLGERLIDIEPTQEHAHRRVMRLHYLRGDRAAAMAAFDHCRIVLKAELGVLPDSETQELQRLVESSDVPGARAMAPRLSAVLRPPRLVGRDGEWQRLQAAWEEGRTSLIVGEAGIGKSRLLADFAAARAGILVRARPGDASVPYAALARLLRALFERSEPPTDAAMLQELTRILPELGAPAAGPLSALRLRLAVETCLRASAVQGLGVIALDDVQFADLATLELLPAFAQGARTPAVSPRWLLASRPGETPEPLRAWSAAQDTDALAAVTLGPLDLSAIGQLLDSLALPGFDAGLWAPAIERHTGGNPMFILETLRSLMDGGNAPEAQPGGTLPLPADVGALIERRLQQLSSEALNLARVAALAGQDFTPDLAASVLERRVIDLAEPWRELEAAQVIRDHAFAHDLILEATQRTVPPAIARALHGDIARKLQANLGTPARIAEHWQAAAAFDAACNAFLEAADAARAVSRLDEELLLLRRADDCLKGGALAGRRAEVLFRALVSAWDIGRIDEMRAFASALEEVAVTPLERLLALEGRMRVQSYDFRFDDELKTFAEAWPLAEQIGTDLQRAFLQQFHANALSRLGRVDEALEPLSACIDWADHNPDHPWLSGMLVETAQTLSYLERYRQSGDVAAQAYRAAERTGNVRHMEMASTNVAMIRYVLGDVEASASEYERSHSLAFRHGGEGLKHWTPASGMARSLRMLGRYDEAMKCAQSQIDLLSPDADGDEFWRTIVVVEVAICYFELGHFARARSVLGATPPTNPDARFRWLLARLRTDSGAQDARTWLDELVRLAGSGMRAASKQWTIVPDLCAVLPPDEALAQARRHVVSCRVSEMKIYLWPMLARAVQALTRAGRTEEAATAAHAMVAECADAQPFGLYVPEVWWILHLAFSAAGEVSAARAALDRAAFWITSTALPTVPDAFRDSFLNRNPVNRAVLAAAKRL